MGEKAAGYAHFDGMSWPKTGDSFNDVMWRLRYGQPTQTDRYFAASRDARIRVVDSRPGSEAALGCSSTAKGPAMTDDQIRSRLREALGRLAYPAAHAIDLLVPSVRDLLSAETQQIREERDRMDNLAVQNLHLLEQAEAETQVIREALDACLIYEARAAVCQGLDGCTCINQSRDTERDYETGNCVHQKAGVALQRLTQASPRTGETAKTGQK